MLEQMLRVLLHPDTAPSLVEDVRSAHVRDASGLRLRDVPVIRRVRYGSARAAVARARKVHQRRPLSNRCGGNPARRRRLRRGNAAAYRPLPTARMPGGVPREARGDPSGPRDRLSDLPASLVEDRNPSLHGG